MHSVNDDVETGSTKNVKSVIIMCFNLQQTTIANFVAFSKITNKA